MSATATPRRAAESLSVVSLHCPSRAQMGPLLSRRARPLVLGALLPLALLLVWQAVVAADLLPSAVTTSPGVVATLSR